MSANLLQSEAEPQRLLDSRLVLSIATKKTHRRYCLLDGGIFYLCSGIMFFLSTSLERYFCLETADSMHTSRLWKVKLSFLDVLCLMWCQFNLFKTKFHWFRLYHHSYYNSIVDIFFNLFKEAKETSRFYQSPIFWREAIKKRCKKQQPVKVQLFSIVINL